MASPAMATGDGSGRADSWSSTGLPWFRAAMGDVLRLADGRNMALFHDDGRFLREGGARTDDFRVYVKPHGRARVRLSAADGTRPGGRACEVRLAGRVSGGWRGVLSALPLPGCRCASRR
jgi:hypothetical protein